MQEVMHRTRHTLGLGTMILGMPCTHQLGESTPPQGVNDLIISYPYLINLGSRIVGRIQLLQYA
jgi:hypothetical protein